MFDFCNWFGYIKKAIEKPAAKLAIGCEWMSELCEWMSELNKMLMKLLFSYTEPTKK